MVAARVPPAIRIVAVGARRLPPPADAVALLASFVAVGVASLAATTSLSLAGAIALVAAAFEVALAAAFLASRKAVHASATSAEPIAAGG